MLGLWPKKFEFQKKKFSKTDTLWFHFNNLDLNRHDRWSMRFDSRTIKIVKQEEHLLSLQNPCHELTLTFLDTLWNVEHLGAIQWTLKRKTDSIQISWGQRKNQMMSLQSSSELHHLTMTKKKASWVYSDERTSRSYWGQCCSKTIHDLVHFSSN